MPANTQCESQKRRKYCVSIKIEWKKKLIALLLWCHAIVIPGQIAKSQARFFYVTIGYTQKNYLMHQFYGQGQVCVALSAFEIMIIYKKKKKNTGNEKQKYREIERERARNENGNSNKNACCVYRQYIHTIHSHQPYYLSIFEYRYIYKKNTPIYLLYNILYSHIHIFFFFRLYTSSKY